MSSNWLRHATLGLGLLLAFAAIAQDEIRVIALKSRPASEVIPIIKPLLGAQDSVSGTDYRLIVRTTPARFKELERVLAQLDVPARQLKLTVRHVLARDAQTMLGELSGQAKVGEGGRVVVTPSAPRDEGGATVELGRGDSTVRYRTHATTSTRADTRAQTLRVEEGKPAFIAVGTSVPHMTRVLGASGKVINIQAAEYQNVTSGFQVTPRLRGQEVLLEVAPRIASLKDPATGLANFAELATTTTAKLGEWTDLGGVMGAHDAVSATILSGETDAAADRWTVLLKVDDVTPNANRGTAAPSAAGANR